MAARPTWKGYLKISLVNIPVRVFPATDSAATVSFNQLHRECRSRINQKKWCATCQTEVANTDIVKGYEFEKGKYVVMEEEDLAKVKTESTRVINIVQFAEPDWGVPFDFDMAQAAATRKAMLAELVKPDTVTGDAHFSDRVFGRLTREDGQWIWHPF